VEQRVLGEHEGDGRIGLPDGDDELGRHGEPTAEPAVGDRDRQAQGAGREQGVERLERERAVAVVLGRPCGDRRQHRGQVGVRPRVAHRRHAPIPDRTGRNCIALPRLVPWVHASQ
jgi:hypothetical protein